MNATQKAQEKIEMAAAFRRWVEESGLTSDIVAKRIGVTEATVANWLNGDSLPTGKALASVKRLVRS